MLYAHICQFLIDNSRLICQISTKKHKPGNNDLIDINISVDEAYDNNSYGTISWIDGLSVGGRDQREHIKQTKLIYTALKTIEPLTYFSRYAGEWRCGHHFYIWSMDI